VPLAGHRVTSDLHLKDSEVIALEGHVIANLCPRRVATIALAADAGQYVVQDKMASPKKRYGPLHAAKLPRRAATGPPHARRDALAIVAAGVAWRAGRLQHTVAWARGLP
jgi:hypothetical protein